MAEQVEYEMSLKDMLSGAINKAKENVIQFEGSIHKAQEGLHGMSEVGSEIMSTLGISFAIFKGVSWLEEGVEKAHKLHEAESQLQNTMQNMGTYSEEAFEKSVVAAGKLSSHINFTKSEVIQLQSQLGMIGSIGEKETNRIITASADMAAKFGMGLNEAGELLGKAINAPEMGRRLAMKLKIDPGVMEHLQNLAKHGHEAEARMQLLAIAEAKVGGAAQAAFDANPLASFNKTMGGIQVEIGMMVNGLKSQLAPTLMVVANAFKSVITWMKEHKTLMGVLASIIVPFAVSVIGITIAVKAWTFAQTLLNIALTANPIGILIASIATLIGVVSYCYSHFEKFRAFLWALWAALKQIGTEIKEFFLTVWDIVSHPFNFGRVAADVIKMKDIMLNAGKDIKDAWQKGWEGGISDFKNSHTEAPKDETNKKGKNLATTIMPTKDQTKGATGTKSVTINVKIDNLIKEFKISTTNIKEGTDRVREMVSQTLMSAVSDSQIVAQ
jgi:hypothetical protein